jgi:Trypsin-co-occurring domain 1
VAYLAEFEVSPGRDVLVEVDATADGFEPLGSIDDGIVRAAVGFSDRLDTIRDAVTETLTKLGEKLNPDEITVSFGIKFSAQAGAMIAKTSLEGNLGVQMVWHRVEAQ